MKLMGKQSNKIGGGDASESYVQLAKFELKVAEVTTP